MNFFRKVWEKVKPEPQKPDEELSDLLLKLNNIHKINKVLYPASGFDANHIISLMCYNLFMNLLTLILVGILGRLRSVKKICLLLILNQ